jgi:hypothetical protein
MKLSKGLLAATLLTVAIPVGAQSLGDLAKKEQERRKASPPAVKTYTNEDLKRLRPMPGGQAPKAGETAKPADPTKPGDPAKAGDPAKPGDAVKSAELKPDAPGSAEPAKDEKYWRGRITAAREDIRRNEMFRDALQTRINALSADFAGRDDPFQRAKIADDRQKAIAEMARVTEEIAKATKGIGDIEEEARRAGVPPGWLR